jgi:DNA repair protein RadC
MTRAVTKALDAVGVQLHDHVVIGRGRHSSFKSLGLL